MRVNVPSQDAVYFAEFEKCDRWLRVMCAVPGAEPTIALDFVPDMESADSLASRFNLYGEPAYPRRQA